MKIAAVLSGDGLYSCGFSSANVFVALFLSQIFDHHLHIVFFLLLLLFLFFFLQIEIRMEIKSALPRELQEKFMTTDSAVLQTKKLNSGEHYADLDTS